MDELENFTSVERGYEDPAYILLRTQALLHDAEAEIKMLKQRSEASEQIVPTLCEDLELAINMALRFAFALGVQANSDPDSLYSKIQALANKYKMHYAPPTDYTYKDMVFPLDLPRATLIERSLLDVDATFDDENNSYFVAQDDDGDPS